MGLHFKTSDETCAYIREKTDTVFLGFSGGKDSTVAWLKLLKFFDRDKIIPICQLFVPGPPEKNGRGTMPYLEKVLDYYEDFFQTRIYRLPHVSFYSSLGGKTYQPPERFDVLEWLNYEGYCPLLDHDEYIDWIRKKTGLEHAWNATGIRMYDNLMRRTAIKTHGSVQPGLKSFYPVWDYTIEQVRQAIVDAGVKLSSDYHWFARSIGGIDARFSWALRDNSPEDYAVLKYWYPNVDLDIFRLECRERLLAKQEQYAKEKSSRRATTSTK